MGWFDNDSKDKDSAGMKPAEALPHKASTPATSSPVASPPRPAGSVLGRRVQVNGTIVSEEDLTIVGRVDGTIHARQMLIVSGDADVRAVVHGAVIKVEGQVTGDIHASDKLVLGSTSTVIGNISTPSLQVEDGAFFKGKVEMRSAVAEPAKPKQSAKAGAPRLAPVASERPAVDAAAPSDRSAVPSGVGQ